MVLTFTKEIYALNQQSENVTLLYLFNSLNKIPLLCFLKLFFLTSFILSVRIFLTISLSSHLIDGVVVGVEHSLN